MRDVVLFLDVPDAGISAMYYQAARSLDLLPLLVTASRSGRCDIAASDCLQVPGMELSSVVSAADRIGRDRIAGVFGHGDQSAELAARIAAALGRPHADPDAIRLCNDKHRLREFLAHKGLNTVKYNHAATASDALSAAMRLGGVVVVKPLSSSGSDGIRICRTFDEAAAHARQLLKRRSDGVLVEEYIDAPQFSIELFDGKALNVKQSYASPGPFPVMIGHDAPADLAPEYFEEIKNYASSIVKEVGLSKGPAAVQLFDSGQEKYVIEINPRPSLNAPIELFVATGINITDVCLKFACAIPYHEDLCVTRRNRACVTRYVVRGGSSVRSIRGIEEARKVPGVRSVYVNDSHFFRRGPGTSARDRVLIVHGEADNIGLAKASVDAALEKIMVVYDGPSMGMIKYHSRKIHNLWIAIYRKCMARISGGALGRRRRLARRVQRERSKPL